MGYRHQTPNLKQALRKKDLEEHVALLHRTFPRHQSTGYWSPDGENWKKEVNQHKYQIYPVDSNFGIAIDIGDNPRGELNIRIATVYPGLKTAVINRRLTLGSKHTIRRKSFVRKLGDLGYKITEEESREKWAGSGFDRKPYEIAATESDCYRTSDVFNQVLRNINAILRNRLGVDACELVVFSPPGDGRRSTNQFGKRRLNDYLHSSLLNIGEKTIVPVREGRVDEEALHGIFGRMSANQALGITSERVLPGMTTEEYFSKAGSHSREFYFYRHTPMIDFKCNSPEEAVHSIERIGINVRDSGLVLIDSGNSFHAHLPRLVHDREEAELYLKRMQEEEFCDKWVPLQAEQRYQLLRVSPCIQKPKIPVVLE